MEKANKYLVRNIEIELIKRGWSVSDLSRVAGLSQSGTYKIVHGERWPSPDNLDRIASALNATVSQLLADPDGTPTLDARKLALIAKVAALNETEVGLLEDAMSAIEDTRDPVTPGKASIG